MQRLFPQKNRISKTNSATKQSLDSIVLTHQDETLYYKQLFTYDDKGNNTSYKSYFWDSELSLWYPHWVEEYNYDNVGNLIQQIDNYWDQNTEEWKPRDNLVSTYDNEGRLILLEDFKWDTEKAEWIDDRKTEYFYDTEGVLVETIMSKFDLGEWDKREKTIFTYNEEGFVILANLDSWAIAIGTWITERKTNYLYDTDWNLTDIILSVMGDDSEWHPYQKTSYTYDLKGNMTSFTDYVWDNQESTWDPTDLKHEYQFDDLNNMVVMLLTHMDFPMSFKTDYFYNNDFTFDDLLLPNLYQIYLPRFNHMLTYGDNFIWNDTTEQWDGDGKETYYYSEQNISDITDSFEESVNVYPNPASDYIYFEFKNHSANTWVEIYDAQGRKVVSREITSRQQIIINHLEKGLYIYKLNQSGSLTSGKLIIE